jgi:hypothetical protein
MYKYYKGEKESPFDAVTQNSAHMFWFYESVFERRYTENDSSDWHAFFGLFGKEKDFMKLLSEEDYNRPTESKKASIFELWLQYLFAEKLYAEYGGENWYKEQYYSTSVQ